MSEKIEQELMLLNRLYKEEDELYRDYAVKIGVSATEFWILYTLCTSMEPCSQRMLSELWFYPKQTINSAIRKLMGAALVVLIPVEGRRNQKIVRLTDKGEAFYSEKVRPLIKAENTAFLQFSEEERALILTLFKKQINCLKIEFDRID
ncbi:MAG: MarR family winged helix-turn-helix transcriptional regulator [Eubacterium aggregans]